jgi:hypothetical protein
MRAVLLALAMLAPLGAAAQTAEPRAQADRLMDIFVKRGVGVFIETVLEETLIGQDANARSSVEQNRARWESEVGNFGQARDAVFAGERSYAPVYRTLCYVIRYPRRPLFLALRYYHSPRHAEGVPPARADGGAPARWELMNYAWHDNLNNWECAAGTPVVPPRN